MYKKIILFFALGFRILLADGQTVTDVNTGGKLSFRGLSVVDNSTVWVSGSLGTIGKSTDGGKNWEWIVVKGYEKSEFRDIEAFGKDVAIIMAIGEPAYILKTVDGGKTWKKVYENAAKGMFLDAMDFKDAENGVVIGDPIDGKFFSAQTLDGGESWIMLDAVVSPAADSGEACFASSGTNIKILPNGSTCFISGGIHSDFIQGIIQVKLPILQGTTSTGANSIALKDSLNYIVVGGDFTNVEAGPNCVLTNDGGQTWTLPLKSPSGYKSCVEYISEDTWIACGLTGVDISKDNGKTWTQISTTSYHACRKAKNGKAVFFSGNESKIGVLVY